LLQIAGFGAGAVSLDDRLAKGRETVASVALWNDTAVTNAKNANAIRQPA
jgi:hypothetical protein